MLASSILSKTYFLDMLRQVQIQLNEHVVIVRQVSLALPFSKLANGSTAVLPS